MLSLEMLGAYDNRPGSQRYPPGLGWFYPDRGDFIAFVSNLASRKVLRRTAAAFRARSDFPAEQLAIFGFVPGVNVRLFLAILRLPDRSAFCPSGLPLRSASARIPVTVKRFPSRARLGLVGLMDPPREEPTQAVDECQAAAPGRKARAERPCAGRAEGAYWAELPPP